MIEDMRGLFFIVKGQFSKTRPVTKGDNIVYIGGYDPTSPDTHEWYQLVDTKTYTCVGGGSDLEKVLHSVEVYIKKCKGRCSNYFSMLDRISKDGHPTSSPNMVTLYKEVYEHYGNTYIEEIKDMEDLAYQTLGDTSPLKKAQLKMKRSKSLRQETTPVKQVVEEVCTSIKVKPKVKLGVKKI